MVTAPLPCRRRPHLLAQLRLLDFQLHCGPRHCKSIWLPTGLQPSKQLSQMGPGASKEPWGPDTRCGGGNMAAVPAFPILALHMIAQSGETQAKMC